MNHTFLALLMLIMMCSNGKSEEPASLTVQSLLGKGFAVAIKVEGYVTMTDTNAFGHRTDTKYWLDVTHVDDIRLKERIQAPIAGFDASLEQEIIRLANTRKPVKLVVYESFSAGGIPGGSIDDYVDLPSGPGWGVYNRFVAIRVGWEKKETEEELSKAESERNLRRKRALDSKGQLPPTNSIATPTNSPPRP